ncbi:MAG: hypothetical protein ACTSV8_02045, partial [Candidatus Thorarchaeota archaeon]
MLFPVTTISVEQEYSTKAEPDSNRNERSFTDAPSLREDGLAFSSQNTMPTLSSTDNQDSRMDSSLPLKSTIEKFVNTRWNAEDKADIVRNNSTISWPKPISEMTSMTNATFPSVTNSSLSVSNTTNALFDRSSFDSTLSAATEQNAGTELFYDDCSSTAGWVSQSSWTGEQLVSQLQT